MKDKNLIYSSGVSMNLHITCVFEVVMLPNKTVIVLFHHFFSQFVHIAEIVHNTTTSRPPAACISQILTTFNPYSGRAGMGL